MRGGPASPCALYAPAELRSVEAQKRGRAPHEPCAPMRAHELPIRALHSAARDGERGGAGVAIVGGVQRDWLPGCKDRLSSLRWGRCGRFRISNCP